jgi:hypothetical protein
MVLESNIFRTFAGARESREYQEADGGRRDRLRRLSEPIGSCSRTSSHSPITRYICSCALTDCRSSCAQNSALVHRLLRDGSLAEYITMLRTVDNTHAHICTSTTHTHKHIKTRTHTHTHAHTQIRTHKHTRTHAHISTYTYTDTHTHTRAYTHKHTHTHTHIYMYAHSHTHKHAYTRTHTRAREQGVRINKHTHYRRCSRTGSSECARPSISTFLPPNVCSRVGATSCG